MARATRWLGAGLGLAVVGYGATVCAAYLRFGRRRPPGPDDDPWLDRFLPTYDIAERHQIRVAAPAPMVLAAALETDLEHSPIIRGIIRTRELVLGATPGRQATATEVTAEAAICTSSPATEIRPLPSSYGRRSVLRSAVIVAPPASARLMRRCAS